MRISEFLFEKSDSPLGKMRLKDLDLDHSIVNLGESTEKSWLVNDFNGMSNLLG